MLLKAKNEGYADQSGTPFVDESGTWKDAVATMRVRYAFKWKDQFGDRYFQNDKVLTVGEALYLAEKIGY